MVHSRRRLAGAAAGCAIAVASALGVPSAAADEVIICPCVEDPPPGEFVVMIKLDGVAIPAEAGTAFQKIELEAYPGVTDYLFLKIG